MQRRSLGFAFIGGGWVFPGGAVEPADHDPALHARFTGWGDAEASERLDVASGGLASWAAAVRECFEEAGVLLARTGAGDHVRLDDPAVGERFAAHRRRLHAREATLLDVLAAEDLQVATDDLAYLSHWVTPARDNPRRFDTRFFVAEVPAAQEGTSDGIESIDTRWVRPSAALASARSGEWLVVRPTARNLEVVGAHETVAAAVASVRAQGPVLSGWVRLAQSEGDWPADDVG
jgi:8-oxo-dGTP pyrophosphatase MutT (NUDIX family)